VRIEMNTAWIWVAATIPLVTGLLVAYPLWRRRVSDEMGSIAGTFVILLMAVALMAREFGEVEAITRRCIEREIGCHFHPDPFTRYSIFPIIGMCQSFVVFTVGLFVEERLRRRAGG
jgi:hypothetical protein